MKNCSNDITAAVAVVMSTDKFKKYTRIWNNLLLHCDNLTLSLDTLNVF